MTKTNRQLDKLANDIKTAKLALCTAVAETFPVSSIVVVTHGRGKFDAQVIGHNQGYWSGAGEVKVVNLKSGIETWRYFTYLSFPT